MCENSCISNVENLFGFMKKLCLTSNFIVSSSLIFFVCFVYFVV